MPSLKVMCDSKKISVPQREYFWEEVNAVLSKEGDRIDIALECLTRVWTGYDMGGHSCGRSLRSFLLEFVISTLKEQKSEDVDKIKLALSILVAMYFDYKYINQQKWFDFKLEGVRDLPLAERIPLCAAAFLLGIDDIPDIAYWPQEFILNLIKG